MKKLKPLKEVKHYGCFNCGSMEMRRKNGEVIACLRTRIYGGFGGWRIEANHKVAYYPPAELDWEDYPTLMKFENMARKAPHKDWRAIADLAMRYAEYQRQGRNRWVLVKTGMGFA